MAFGFSRNIHHLTHAIEESGFEIRDHMMWIYSSGMPRSYSVSNSVKKSIKKTQKVSLKIAGGHLEFLQV